MMEEYSITRPDLVCLAVLRGIGEDDFGDARRVFEQVVKSAPVPTGLDYRFPRAVERLEVGREGLRCVMVDAGLLQKAALLVERAGYRITFVMVDSGVVHVAAKGITHRQSARFFLSCRSCYLTPFACPFSFDPLLDEPS